MIPLYGFLEGDTIGLLILARAEDTIAELASRLRTSAAVRVARQGPVSLHHGGRLLDERFTVAQAGMAPLDRFDVRFRPSEER
jgi:hypothetical protein